MDLLVAEDVKLAVVACNSASAAAFDELKAAYPLPVVEVIEPAVRAAVRLTRNRNVGLIGTEGTIGSGRYREAIEETHENVTLVAQACPRFVEYVERGETTGPEILELARGYLAPLLAAEVDTLILGCTHYPLLTGVIGYLVGPDVFLVNSAEWTARSVFAELTRADLHAPYGARPPTGSSPPATPTSSAGSAPASSARRSAWWSGAAPPCRSRPRPRDPAHRARQLRDLPGRRPRLLRVPAGGGRGRPGDQGLGRHRPRHPVQPAPGGRAAHPGRHLGQPPARRPRRRPAGGQLRPALRRLPAAARAGAGVRPHRLGQPRAAVPVHRRERAHRRHLRGPRPARRRAGRPGAAAAGGGGHRPLGGDLRGAGHRRRPHPRLLGRLGVVRRPRAPGRPGRPVRLRGRLVGVAGGRAPDPPDPAAGRGVGGQGQGQAAAPHPPAPRQRPRRPPPPAPPRPTAARWASPPNWRYTTSDGQERRADPRTSCGRSRSPSAGRRRPSPRPWSSWAGPRWCARSATRTGCRRSCAAAARAG